MEGSTTESVVHRLLEGDPYLQYKCVRPWMATREGCDPPAVSRLLSPAREVDSVLLLSSALASAATFSPPALLPLPDRKWTAKSA